MYYNIEIIRTSRKSTIDIRLELLIKRSCMTKYKLRLTLTLTNEQSLEK